MDWKFNTGGELLDNAKGIDFSSLTPMLYMSHRGSKAIP